MSGWSGEKLGILRQDLADRLAAGEPSDAPAAEALAAVREAVRRVHGQHLTDECILAGLAMADGQVADLAADMDGYLISAVPAFLSVLRGHTVHAVSLDSASAGHWSQRLDGVLGALGLSSGLLAAPPDRVERKHTYGADVVHGGYDEFGYDYLRDNLAAAPDDCVQRGNKTAIVGDIEAILVRQAGRRLIIMRTLAPDPEHYHKTAALAGRLIRGVHFELDDQTGEVSLDTSKLADETGPAGGAWTARREWELTNAIRARMWYRPGADFSLQQGEIILIDGPGSRLRGGQGYAEGIRQALEAHAGVRIAPVQLPQARITVRDYFRTYAALSGMSSTAAASAGELAAAYGVQVADARDNTGRVAGGSAGRVPSADQPRSPEDFERQLTWLKLDAEIEGEQRERFYTQRRELVRTPDLRPYTLGLLEGVIDTYLSRYRAPRVLLQALFRLYETPLSVGDLSMPGAGEKTEEYDAALRARLYEDIWAAYAAREQLLGSDTMRRLERRVIVPVLDEGWSLHLAELDAIFRLARSHPGAEFASIYCSRAHDSYKAMLDHINENIAGYLFHLEDTT
jgi:preprotein translocase subunit SecA